jgi:hypothetical protein
MPNDNGKARIYRNRCRLITNHSLEGRYVLEWQAPQDVGLQGEAQYSLWVCAGCETGLLEVRESDSESDDEDGRSEYSYEYFPKRMREGLTQSFMRLEPTLEQIDRETIGCFNDGSLILSTAGLRALLEGVCEDKRISGRDLRTKIDNLRSLLPNENIIDSLHITFDLRAMKPFTI